MALIGRTLTSWAEDSPITIAINPLSPILKNPTLLYFTSNHAGHYRERNKSKGLVDRED